MSCPIERVPIVPAVRCETPVHDDSGRASAERSRLLDVLPLTLPVPLAPSPFEFLSFGPPHHQLLLDAICGHLVIGRVRDQADRL